MAGTLRVTYKSPFTRASTEASDMQSACFLPITCEDIVEVGIALRMMSAREIKRNFTESQSDTRRAEEVPPGAISNSVSQLTLLRRNRITAEAARLKAQYPQQFRR
jgi:L-lactate utilization protein LutB